MVMQVRALLRVVELVVVVILTKLVIRRYRRWDGILLRGFAKPIHRWVIWVMITRHFLPIGRRDV